MTVQHDQAGPGPEPEAGAKPKRAISPARLAANRANSSRSTGPRTPLGKSVSKFNGLVHGMRAASDILPGEDPEALDRRIATWADELGAETESERYLAEAAARASWRIDRCRGAVTAALSRRVLTAGEDYDDALAEEVERLGERLGDDPAGVVRQLRRSTAGCRWLLGRWATLAERLDGWKGLEPTERHLAAHLMGRRQDDLFDPAVAGLLAAYLGALRIDAERACQYLRDDRPEGMSEVEFERRIGSLCAAMPDPEAGHAAQVAIVAGAIDELAERLELVEAREARDRELAVREASFDATPAGACRLRYEMSHERVLRASLRDLRAMQKGRPESGNAGSAENDGVDASSLPAPINGVPTEAIAPTEATTEAVAPSEAIAPTEAKPDAVAPTEAKPTAGSPAVAPTEARPSVLAPTEAKPGSTRPVVTSPREELGTPSDPISYPIWPPSMAEGIGRSFAATT